MDFLDVFLSHADPPDSTQVPMRFASQVLNHDTRKDDYLCLHVIDDGVVG